MGVYELSGAGSLKTPRTVYSSMNAGNQYGAMVPIASTTLAADTATIAFSSIPQTYQDLFIVCSIRNTSSTPYQGYIYTNHTTYTQTFLKGNGSSATSSRYSGGIGIYFGLDGVPSTASTFTVASTHFLNYANTTTFKTGLLRCANDLNGSGTTELSVGLLQGTNAITTVGVALQAGLLTTGSTATLYGIRAVSS